MCLWETSCDIPDEKCFCDRKNLELNEDSFKSLTCLFVPQPAAHTTFLLGSLFWDFFLCAAFKQQALGEKLKWSCLRESLMHWMAILRQQALLLQSQKGTSSRLWGVLFLPLLCYAFLSVCPLTVSAQGWSLTHSCLSLLISLCLTRQITHLS